MYASRQFDDSLKIRGFPKIRGTLLEVPIIRIIVFGRESILESDYSGKVPCELVADLIHMVRLCVVTPA